MTAELQPQTTVARRPAPTAGGLVETARPKLDPEALIWAEINLDAIAANVRVLRSHVGTRVQLVAVVKANAYGHGAVPVATAALAAGAHSLAVGRLDEAVELRDAGIAAPILVMGPVPASAATRCITLRLTPTVQDLTVARALAHAARTAGQTVPAHIKVDTGMTRFGLLADEAVAFTCAVAAIEGLEVEGLYTHFAAADAGDLASTQQQLASLLDLVGRLRAVGINPAVLHAANSAATLALPAAHLDQVRVGAALYGLHTTGSSSAALALRPVLTLKTRVIRLRYVPAGTPVSYGSTYHTTEATCLATLAAGYGDGLSVALSGRGAVLLGGKTCRVVGRVCMDQLVVDCRDGSGVQEGDAAVLIGQQGEASITAEDVAEVSGTINYEVVTRLSARVPRFYQQGQAITSAPPLNGTTH
ncbi:MAG: alanine racemase [Dehalococcoidia bacterium]|nr:alanine racemase [Dehalococcoidia bacterium]